MLTDAAIKALKPQSKMYKVADRDGMYVRVMPSGAIEKQREKRRLKEAKSFGEFGEKWLVNAPMADSTRAMRRSIFERELLY